MQDTTKFTKLFSAARLGNLTLPNRAVLSPMTRTSAEPDGKANDKMRRYYERFAKGGFGLIITEGVYPDHTASRAYDNQPGIADRNQAESWSPVVKAIHQSGGKVIAQLMHAGALVQHDRFVPLAPSAVRPIGRMLEEHGGSGQFRVPREMTNADIKEVVRHFASAAERARQAGFDGVEVHGANGYLIDQFLTDYTNERSDEYGGETERRVKLAVEVLQAIREAVGRDYVVGIRISQGKVNDFHHKWAGKEADAAVIFRKLAEASADYIHTTEHRASDSAFDDGGPTLAALARRYSGLQVIANGKLGHPPDAEQLLQQGDCDLVAIGTVALVNPDWVRKARSDGQMNEFHHNWLHPIATIRENEI